MEPRPVLYSRTMCLGTNLGGLAIISGVAAIILAEPLIRTVLLFASAAYLGYLALRIGLAGTKLPLSDPQDPDSSWLTLALINPKAYAVNTNYSLASPSIQIVLL